ncbi:hypothetical protein QJS10_CPB04g00327 [Acorus calamus]|uniref:Cytochrome b561 domain-containing protein n=1 Tax=Acorus calamus TaxID=4465 RepID=A0AAV9EXF5_ACOCL|nr:hypothetical protein QJS10_CPB04g00327 [Acorus calamus]
MASPTLPSLVLLLLFFSAFAPAESQTCSGMAKGTVDLLTGVASGSDSGGGRIRKKNVHGLLNAVSGGILLPFGAIVARGMKMFDLTNPAWFYLHDSSEIIGHVVGVAGGATNFRIRSKSKGVVNTLKSVETVVFSLHIIQVLALFLKPREEHRYRPYWELCYQAIRYAAIILRVVDVFKGLAILKPYQRWWTGCVVVVSVLFVTLVALEGINFVMKLGRKKSTNATKPYDHELGL